MCQPLDAAHALLGSHRGLYVVVLLHSGAEEDLYPGPNLQDAFLRLRSCQSLGFTLRVLDLRVPGHGSGHQVADAVRLQHDQLGGQLEPVGARVLQVQAGALLHQDAPRQFGGSLVLARPAGYTYVLLLLRLGRLWVGTIELSINGGFVLIQQVAFSEEEMAMSSTY